MLTTIFIRILIVAIIIGVYSLKNFAFTDSQMRNFDVRYIACDGDFVVAGFWFIVGFLYIGLALLAILNIIFFYT